jgi:hypothetical protein
MKIGGKSLSGNEPAGSSGGGGGGGGGESASKGTD